MNGVPLALRHVGPWVVVGLDLIDPAPGHYEMRCFADGRGEDGKEEALRTMLTADMKRVIDEQKLGFVATVNEDGTPNLSPKATFIVLDDETIAYVDIRSPNTLRNIERGSPVDVNFVDPFVRKGYRFKGTAEVLPRGTAAFDAAIGPFAAAGDLLKLVGAVVRIRIASATALISPAYDRGQTEDELRRSWTARFRAQQPGGAFTTEGTR